MKKIHCFIDKCYKRNHKKMGEISGKKREMKAKTIKIKITKTQKLEEKHIFRNKNGKNDHFYLNVKK